MPAPAPAIVLEVGSRRLPPGVARDAGSTDASGARRLRHRSSAAASIPISRSRLRRRQEQSARARGGDPGRREPGSRLQPAVHLRRRRSRQDAPDARGRQHDPQRATSAARVAYVHSERFVGDMVKALQHNTINDFKTAYRSLDALLIDDIQFFAGKDRSQEEFFHTFNALFEGQQQIILTCDRYPKEVDGLEERLKSRFGWGLTVAIEPPELETCVAILMSKAAAAGVDLPEEVAFFIAKRIRSNVRELEGALRRVVANSQFTGRAITMDFAKEALRDLLALQDRLVTIENIQKTVAEYYKIRVADLLSKRRSRSIARPRQVAMALAKELTSHSLPEIGDAFGGRDHTTVLHACRVIKELRDRTRAPTRTIKPVENPGWMMWISCGRIAVMRTPHFMHSSLTVNDAVVCRVVLAPTSAARTAEIAVMHSFGLLIIIVIT